MNLDKTWKTLKQILCHTFVDFFKKKLCIDLLQDSEAASCKMNSLGSNHSIPSTSVSTGSQSSSVNSMQEMLDDGCSDMTMMHPQDYSSTLESSPHTKKVKITSVVALAEADGSSLWMESAQGAFCLR